MENLKCTLNIDPLVLLYTARNNYNMLENFYSLHSSQILVAEKFYHSLFHILFVCKHILQINSELGYLLSVMTVVKNVLFMTEG